MCKKLVSIIIPLFNAEKYIERCVKSIENQTYKNIQIILVNDGSTDHSKDICEALKKKDERIFVVNKNNEGVSVARNIGLQYAEGEYITFLDVDDWVEKNYVYELCKGFENKNVDIVCCAYYKDNGDKAISKMRIESKIVEQDEALDCFSTYYFTSVWGKMYKADIIKTLKFETDIFYSEDTLFYTQAVLQAKKILWIDKALYHYYVNENGAMKNKNIKKYYTDFLARKKIVKLYQKKTKLLNGAIYMTLQSAASIKLEIAKQVEIKDFESTELDSWIKNNYILGLRIAKKNKDRVKIILCRYHILYILIRKFYKIKSVIKL